MTLRKPRSGCFSGGPPTAPRYLTELDNLPRDARAAVVAQMRRYLAGDPRIGGGIKPVTDDIYELLWRRQGNTYYRVLLFLWGVHPVGLTIVAARHPQTPQAEIDRAVTRQKAWTTVFGQAPD